jgi:tRNA modification GTPase
MYAEDTIAAVATPPGEGGIAIIRISGPEAERIARKIFSRHRGNGDQLGSHKLYHGTISDPQTRRVFDEVLLAVMRKPHSYTGEEVVEIHCHGGAFLVRQVLGLILAQGARHAEPGEFTKRAFLNGRLDLAQAEGVLDLIRARTDKGVELALGQATGELSKWVDRLREELLAISVQIEASIDFSEEDIELLQRRALVAKIERLRAEICSILSTYDWGRLFREGARVCICGRPNVGKSSLLNALLGEERVIVTEVPGTTRDVIEESINLDGLPVVLWDTAGIRESGDRIEQIGVKLSRQHVEKSDALIVVLDGSESLAADDLTLLQSLNGKKALIAVNKSDLPQMLDVNTVKACAGSSAPTSVSAKSGAGVDTLRKSLRSLLIGCTTEPAIVLTNIRHKSALERCSKALGDTVNSLSADHPAELVAVVLTEARDELEEIVGVISSDNILESIFKDYCIGK